MAKYVLVMEQEADGCDYSIGCGTRIYDLKATTADAARAEATNFLLWPEEGHVDESDDHCLRRAWIAGYVEEIPLGPLRDEYARKRDASEREVRESAERAELERLQAKYGKR